MTKKAKLAIEMSEKRQALNELLGLDELSTEQRAEMSALTARLQELEPELRAAIVAEESHETRTEGTGEAAELRALADRCNMGAIFAAVLEHRNVEGPERELQTHYGLAGNMIPLELLMEHRAVTPAPGQVGQNASPIIPGVFPQSCAAFLGIDTPRVAVGDAVFPVLTKNADVRTPAENADATETTGSFSATVLSPARLQAAFFYSREDRARFAGMDAALRENLSMALSDGLDDQILSGTTGLLTGTVLPNNNVTAETTYALYRSQFAYGRVDGRYATSTGDLRIVMGSATYAHAASQYRGASDNVDALMALMNATGGVKVSAHVPDVASKRQNAVIRLGARRDYVAPMWEGITLIPDEVTLAANGQIKVTAVMLYAASLLRAAGFYKQQTQHP